MQKRDMGGPVEGRIPFYCFQPKPEIQRAKSEVQHDLWSNSKLDGFRAFKCVVFHICVPKRASDQHLCCFNFFVLLAMPGMPA